MSQWTPGRLVLIEDAWWVGMAPARVIEWFGDPCAPPEILKGFLELMGERQVPEEAKRALASNPGLPLHDLMPWALNELVRTYPKQVLANPAFRLRITLKPELLDGLSMPAQLALLERDEVPPEFIRRLAASNRICGVLRSAAASNPACPPDLQVQYLKHSRLVRNSLSLNPRLLPEVAEVLARDIHWAPRCCLAAQGPMSEALLDVLAHDPNWRVRAGLASRRGLSAELCALLSRDVYYRVRLGIAEREDAPREVLLEMAAREQGRLILLALIGNESVPAEALGRLRRHRSEEVRVRLKRREADEAFEAGPRASSPTA